MNLSVEKGSYLGPYEILSKLGSGGMGEVYRARDPRLKRDVAIKILPAQTEIDSSSKQRFQREAQAASALNHPNILVVHDIGTHNGINYIVSELLDGLTLRQIIKQKPISVKESIEIAIDIATGLAAAHHIGIVHRDLKPENVIITKQKYTKILDFGLSKFVNLGELRRGAQTISTSLTESGVIHGTVPYMSPEQASGSSIDYRSDQFSLGILFYEMLTGKRPFQKATAIETLNAIIQEDPESISTEIPVAIRWVVQRCLQKNPSDRYSSTEDLVKELKDIQQHLSELTSIERKALETTPKFPISKILNVIFAILILGLTALIFSFATKDLDKIRVKDYMRLTFRRGTIDSARFAPDGETIVYAAMLDGMPKDLYLSRKNGLETRSLGLANADVLSISNSGNMLILIHRDKEIMAQVPLSGGSPRELAEGISSADWSPDGKQIAITTSGFGGSKLEYPIGKVVYRSIESLNLVRVSPKGNAIAFREFMHGDNGVVRIIDLNGKVLATSQKMWPQGLAWSSIGDKVWFTSTALEAGRGAFMYTLDLRGSQKLVERFPGWPQIIDIHRNGQMILDFSDGGSIVMYRSETFGDERNFSVLDDSFLMDFSSDGKRLLIWESGEGSEGQLGTTYMRSTDGSPAIRLTNGFGKQFSNDGRWILAKLNPTTAMLVPTGAGNVKYLTHPDMVSYTPIGFIPHQKKVVIGGTDKSGSTFLFIHDTDGGKPQLIQTKIVSRPFYLFAPISPDGNMLAAENSEGLIALFDLKTGKSKPLLGIKNGEQPIQWSRDGSSVLVFEPFKIPAKIYKINVSSGERLLFKTLIPPEKTGVEGIWLISFSDDEKSYAYSFQRYLSVLYMVEGFE